MTPDATFDREEVERPEGLHPDVDKTVFDPETGEWITIREANQMADERAEDRIMEGWALEDVPDSTVPDEESDERSWKRLLQRLLPHEEKKDSVFDPETGEWLTVEEARRQTALRVAEADEDGVGLIEEDVGKPVVAHDIEDVVIGKVIHVEDGRAYVKQRITESSRGGDAVMSRLVKNPAVDHVSSSQFPEFEVCRIPPDLVSLVTTDAVHLKDLRED